MKRPIFITKKQIMEAYKVVSSSGGDYVGPFAITDYVFNGPEPEQQVCTRCVELTERNKRLQADINQAARHNVRARAIIDELKVKVATLEKDVPRGTSDPVDDDR